MGHQRDARSNVEASRIGLGVAAVIGAMFVVFPEQLLSVFGMTEPLVTSIGKGNEGLTGSYCIKDGTTYNKDTACTQGECLAGD